MAFPTTPAYVIVCKGWEERHREHPIFDWMTDHELAFDVGNAKQEPYTNWYTKDFLYVDSAGKTSNGPQAWDDLLSTYAPLASHFHEPFFAVIFKNDEGLYELIGCAKIFANLLVPGGGNKKKDFQGREWDVEIPGSFHFVFAEDKTGNKGYKMSSWKLYADGLPMVAKLLERGMVTQEDLLKKMAG